MSKNRFWKIARNKNYYDLEREVLYIILLFMLFSLRINKVNKENSFFYQYGKR